MHVGSEMDLERFEIGRVGVFVVEMSPAGRHQDLLIRTRRALQEHRTQIVIVSSNLDGRCHLRVN